MGISQIGIPGLVLIVFLALILFGPKKLPEMGKAFGETLKEFKKSTQDLTGNVVKEMNDTKEAITAESTKAEVVDSTDNK